MGTAIIARGISFAEANLGKVTISGSKELVSLSIVSPDSITGSSALMQVAYNPINATDRQVRWSIDSNTYATINEETGLLSIKSNANNSVITITATSVTKPSISASKTIVVTFEMGDVDWVYDIYDEYIGSANNKYNAYFPVCFDTQSLLANKEINVVKFASQGEGTITLAVCDIVSEKAHNVREIGTYNVKEGKNEIVFDTVTLSDGQTIGFTGVTGTAAIRVKAYGVNTLPYKLYTNAGVSDHVPPIGFGKV